MDELIKEIEAHLDGDPFPKSTGHRLLVRALEALRQEEGKGCACRFKLVDGWLRLLPDTECGYHRAIRGASGDEQEGR